MRPFLLAVATLFATNLSAGTVCTKGKRERRIDLEVTDTTCTAWYRNPLGKKPPTKLYHSDHNPKKCEGSAQRFEQRLAKEGWACKDEAATPTPQPAPPAPAPEHVPVLPDVPAASSPAPATSPTP